ncbi:histidine--tRNA ligase, partial [Candidatus Zixiibacteriota bacterium]
MSNKKKTTRVKPQLLKGFRDYPPHEQLVRDRMITKICNVVETMGFLPLQTASLELAETLLGSHYNTDSLSELFGFQGPDEVDMALRYEFTLSLARYVAADQNIALPFRRYQYGNVWRVDKPGPGRYREFMQFDIDIVGTLNLLADAEIIAAMVNIFTNLGVNNFKVRFSNRKILNGLIEFAGIQPEKGPDVMRVIDKLEKQGRAAVIEELGSGRVDKSGDKIKGLELEASQILEIEKFFDIAQNSNSPLDDISNLLGHFKISDDGINELNEVSEYLKSMSVNEKLYEIDLTIVRGLGYYTGPVFETTLLDLPDYGSVFSGGRYDDLVNRFSSRSMPGVGSSIGIDRLLAALIELNAIEMERATSKVLVTVMDRDRLNDYLSILKNLRDEGIAAEIFTGDTKNLTKQVKYADKVGIPFAVIRGSDEFEQNMITVKNLKA